MSPASHIIMRRAGSRARLASLLILILPAFWVLVPVASPLVVECLIALSLFVLIKRLVLIAYSIRSGRPAVRDQFAWYCAWPGLDAAAFFRRRSVRRPGRGAWWVAGARTVAGLGLVLVAPMALTTSRYLAGWIVLVGLVTFLHFGLFHLAALAWRHAGRDVRPIMNKPLRSTSVTEFWSRRWNLAFRDFASAFLFKPLARTFSPAVALMVGYVFSGLMHELAISLPAGRGYGGPTLYFVLQGCAVFIERRLVRAGWLHRSGWRGWIWTAVVVAPGALILFHPPFVTTVAAPVAECFSVFDGDV